MTDPSNRINISQTPGDWSSSLKHFSHEAMATNFEVIISHKNHLYAEQAACAAFNELDKLEAQLSKFIDNSDISQINRLPPNQPLVLGPAAFEAIQICQRLYADTNGAFDITVGSLMDCWITPDKHARSPSMDEIASARQHTGMDFVNLDSQKNTIELTRAVKLDMGGFGKGYAVDKMADILRDWDIETALIHGGHSTALAIGTPAGRTGWPVTISNPQDRSQAIISLNLCNMALSGSGLEKGQHIIDPHGFSPVRKIMAAWSWTESAAIADGLSTAFMVMSPSEITRYCQSHQPTRALVMPAETCHKPGEDKFLRFGPR